MHALGVAFQCELLLHAAEGIPMGINTVHKPLVHKEMTFLIMSFVSNATLSTPTRIVSIEGGMVHQPLNFVSMLFIQTTPSYLDVHPVIHCF